MASILRVNTLTDASSNNSTAVSVINQGSCKHWVKFEGDGTVAVSDSTNNASITDDGTGDYTITIANDFSSVNFAMLGTGNQYHVLNDSANTAGTMQYGNYNNSHARSDTARCFAAGFGDLA